MPTEVRFITFDLEEIYHAISILCRQHADMPQVPQGCTPKSVEIEMGETDKDAVIYLTVAKHEGEDEKLAFDRTVFVTGLILLCQATNIPLPRKGTKAIKVQGDKVVMKIDLESSLSVPESVPSAAVQAK